MSELQISYHLPQSTVVVSGSKTTQVDLTTGQRVVVGEVTTEVTTEIEADPHDWLRVQPPDSWLSDSKLSVELTDDGRLVSIGASSTGKAGQAAKSVVSFFTTSVAALAGAAARAPAPPGPKGWETEETRAPESTPVHSYDVAHPDNARRITEINGVVESLLSKQLAFYQELVDATDPKDRYAAARAARQMASAGEELRGELSLLVAHKAAWTAAIQDRRVEEYEHRMRATELVDVDDIETWPDDELPEEAAAMGMVRDLHVVVARKDVPVAGGDGESPEWDGSSVEGIWFRHPRRVELVVYSHRPDGGGVGPASPKPYLVEVDRRVVHVVDDSCRHEVVRFDSKAWGESSVSTTFNALGGLASLSSEDASAAAAAAEALGSMPETVSTALTTATGILESAGKIEDHAVSRAITRLDNEKKLLESEIAADTAVATETQQRQKALLQSRKELLDAVRDLGKTGMELEVQRLAGGSDIAQQVAELQKKAFEARRDLEASVDTAQLHFAGEVATLMQEVSEAMNLAHTAKTELEERQTAEERLLTRLEALEAKLAEDP